MLKGIDISKHNGNINFENLKNDIDFIIIRCAYRGITNRKIFIDEKFKNNIKEANRLNIPVGLYIYSTARTTDEAIEEAEFCIALAKAYKINYPISIDIEDNKNQGNLSKNQLSNIIKFFCDTIEKNNYYAMYYCNKDWYLNKLDHDILKPYDKWIAQWNKEKCDVVCGIWQYSDKGKADGINGPVDLNYSFKDYSKIINTIMPNIERDITVGSEVSFNKCYISSDSDNPLNPLYGHGKITKILSNKKNPYLINENDCWIRKEDIL